MSPELVEVGSAADKWQQPFDAALTDVFQVQADIASQVAQALGIALGTTARATLATRPTQNLAAYDSLLRGDQVVITEGRLDPEAFRTAAAAYRAAVRLDSTFGLAWGRLAWAETYLYNEDVGGPENDSISALAKQAADRALALAPELGQTYNAIAAVRHVIYGDYLGAIAAMERARALAPYDVDILTQLAAKKAEFLGSYDEAIPLCNEATHLDPRSPLVARRCAFVLGSARRFRAADSLASAALKTAPENLALLAFAAVARVQQGDLPGARAIFHDALAHVPAHRLVTRLSTLVWLMDDSVRTLALRLPPEAFGGSRAAGLLTIADLNWDQGRYGAARASADSARPLLEQQVAQRPTDDGLVWALARAHAYLGQCTEALQLRERLRVMDRYKPRRVESIDAANDRLYITVRCGAYASAVAWVDSLVHTEQWGVDTPTWFRLNPAYAPLRGRPDFDRLVAGK